MNGLRHPYTGAHYEQDGNGRVRVTLGDAVGIFAIDGRWIEGTLRDADPQLCGWVGGPMYGNHRLTESKKS